MILVRCAKCGKELEPHNFWWRRNNTIYDTCKDCCLTTVNVYSPDTLLPIFKALDIPYISAEYVRALKYAAFSKRTTENNAIKHCALCKYIAQMKLLSFRRYGFNDTAQLNQTYFENQLEKDMNNNG